MSPAGKARIRRARRIVLRGMLVLIAVVVIGIGSAIAALHTAWGRDKVRAEIEGMLDDAFVGDVSIGRLDGSVFGVVTLRDVVIRDSAGDPAITVAAMRVDLALLPLLDQEARFYRIALEGLVVDGRPLPDGRLNLSAMTEEQEDPPTWDLVFDEIVVRGGRLTIAGTDRVDHFDGLDVAARIAMPTAGAARFDAAVSAFWRERGLPVRLDTQLTAGEEVTEIESLDAGLGALAATARAVRIRGDQITGDVTIDAPAAAVRALVPDSPLIGEVHLALTASDAPGGATLVAVDGTVGGAGIGGAAVYSAAEPRLTGMLRVTDANAAAILADSIRTDLDAALTIDIGGEDARGVATISARGTGEGGLRADLDAAVILDGDDVHLGGAHLVATATDLARTFGEVAPVHGTFTADLRAHGRIAGGEPRLAIRGTVDGKRIRIDRHRVRSLHLDLDTRGVPHDPSGSAKLAARGVVVDGSSAGDLFFDARSRADRAIAVRVRSVPPWKPFRLDLDGLVRVGDEVTIALGEHRLRTHWIDWHGRGGTIAIGHGKVSVARLRTSIARGHLVVNGTYHHGDRQAGDFATSIHLDHLDLAEVARSLQLPDRVRGEVDAQVHIVKRGRRWYGSIVGAGEQLVMRDGATPIDVRAEARLAPEGIRIDAAVTGRGVGTATVDLDLVPPRRLEDPAAWMRLERDAIRTGRVMIDGLDLEGITSVAGIDAGVTGRLDGELTLTATESHGRLVARGVTAGGMDAPIDAELTIDQVGGDLVAAQLVATVREVGTARAEATVGVPARPFDLAAWARVDADSVRGATLRVDDLVLDAKRSKRLGLVEPWFGRADLLVEVAPGLREVIARLDLTGVRGGPLARPVDVQIRASGDATGASVTLTGSIGGTQVLTGEAKLPLALDDLRRRGADALRDAALTATLEVDSKIGPIAAAFGRPQKLVGTVDATVTIGGTVGAPTATAAIRFAGVGMRKARLRELTLDAAWDGRVVTAAARGSQGDGGRLRIDARADVQSLDAATAAIEAEGFDLAPLAQLGPARFLGVAGILDADVRLRGLDPATARIDGTVRLEEARLPLGGNVGTLRDGEIVASLRGGKLSIEGEGRIGSGSAELRAHATMRGLTPDRADLSVRIDGVTLIGEVQPRVSGTVKAKLRRDGDRWKVDATVRAARVVVPAGEGKPLHEPGLPEDMVIIENGKPAPSTLEPEPSWKALLGIRPTAPWLIVTVKILPVGIQTPEFRGKLRGDLTLTIGDDGIAVDGEIETTTGSVALFDRRYRIDHAAVRFDGSVDPTLDVQLVHEFPQVTMFVTVRGRLSQPDLELSSRPATYTEGQLLSFLLGGSPGMNPGSEVRDAATGVASALLSKKVGGYVGDYLPVEVDVLRFEAATASTGAAFTVGKWLSRRLFVAYRRRLDARTDENAGEGEVEYWLRPDILVEATVGDRGHHDADLLWLKRW